MQWGIPNVTLINYSGIGDSTEGPYANDNNTLQFVDNFSWIRGKHTFRFGGEFRREHYNQVGNQFARGQFTFQPNATQNPATKTGGDTFADFLLGDLYQSEAAVSIASAKFLRNSWAFYIDDTWKVTRRTDALPRPALRTHAAVLRHVTRNVFSVYMPYVDTHAQRCRPEPLSAVHPRGQLHRSLCRHPRSAGRRSARCCDGRLGDALVQTDHNDFAPRIGISYSPDSKWVIRTGFGMFYNQDTGNPRFDMARNIAGRIRVELRPAEPDAVLEQCAVQHLRRRRQAQITSPTPLRQR